MTQPRVTLNPLGIAIGQKNGNKSLSMVVIRIRDHPQHWEIRPRLANEVNGQETDRRCDRLPGATVGEIQQQLGVG